jgi:hypothetical protein
LLNILILFIFVYFFLNLLPIIIFKIYSNLDLRHTYEGKIFLFDFFNISINQNVNGQARILFILQIFFLILFKKYNSKKKFIYNIFFCISALLLFIIFLMQSRFIIIASFISSFFIIIYNHNLNLKKKIFYLLFLITTIAFAATISKPERFFNFNEENILTDKINNYNIGKHSLKEENILTDKINNYNIGKHSLKYEITVCSTNANVNKIDSILSGRVCGWEILIKNLDKDLLFGKGFFADQALLLSVQKTSSNSWINIIFNAGFLSLIIILLFITIFLFKYFKLKNINHKNIYVCISYYLVIFILCRSLLEDTIVFLNIDLIITLISLLIIKDSKKMLYKNK